MRDEQYQAQQIPAYGSPGQPALRSRAARPLRSTLVGTVLAAAGFAAAVVAYAIYPRWFAGSPWWALATAVGALGLLACCLAQHFAWRRAAGIWSGGSSEAGLDRLSRISWSVHLIAYGCTAISSICGFIGMAEAGWSTAAVLLFVAVVGGAVALVLAGVQYVRVSGAPGALPAHMRRLVNRG